MKNIYENFCLDSIVYFCEYDNIWKTEQWRYILGFEKEYQISDLGRVKSFKNNKVKILKLRFNKDKYLYVGLTINFYQKMFLSHRLVAENFIPNPDNKETVNHINGIKIFNRVKNLEWNTRSENIQHADLNGLRIMKKGTDCYNSILTEENVLFIRSSNLKQKELAKMFNIDASAISNVINKKSWKHL